MHKHETSGVRLVHTSSDRIAVRRQVLTIPSIVRDTLTTQTSPAQLDGNVVIDWVASIAAIPKFENNLELLWHLNFTPLAALYFGKDIYKTGDRCENCFTLHSGECTFPPFYDKTPLKWIDRCVVCHEEKKYSDRHLCGSIPCAMTFILITNPTSLHINSTRSIPIEWI